MTSQFRNRKDLRNLSKSDLIRIVGAVTHELNETTDKLQIAHDTVEMIKAKSATLRASYQKERESYTVEKPQSLHQAMLALKSHGIEPTHAIVRSDVIKVRRRWVDLVEQYKED